MADAWCYVVCPSDRYWTLTIVVPLSKSVYHRRCIYCNFLLLLSTRISSYHIFLDQSLDRHQRNLLCMHPYDVSPQ